VPISIDIQSLADGSRAKTLFDDAMEACFGPLNGLKPTDIDFEFIFANVVALISFLFQGESNVVCVDGELLVKYCKVRVQLRRSTINRHLRPLSVLHTAADSESLLARMAAAEHAFTSQPFFGLDSSASEKGVSARTVDPKDTLLAMRMQVACMVREETSWVFELIEFMQLSFETGLSIGAQPLYQRICPSLWSNVASGRTSMLDVLQKAAQCIFPLVPETWSKFAGLCYEYVVLLEASGQQCTDDAIQDATVGVFRSKAVLLQFICLRGKYFVETLRMMASGSGRITELDFSASVMYLADRSMEVGLVDIQCQRSSYMDLWDALIAFADSAASRATAHEAHIRAGTCPIPKECEAVAFWDSFQEGLLQKRMLTKVLKQQVPAPVPATSTGEGIASATAATAPPASATSVTSATAPTAGTATATGTAQTSQKTSTSTSTSTYLSIAAIRQKWSIPGCDVSSLTLDTRGCNSMLQKLASYLGFHLGPFWDPDGAPFGTCQTGTH
jgi:hypothetical protein